MANRYWTGAVNGGTGTWDTSNTANWSATSGGAGGASVPTTGDLAFFDANSGSGTCTLGSDVTVSVLNLTGYTGTLDFATFKIGVTGTGTTILNLGTTAAMTGSKRIEITANATTGTRTLTGSLTSSPGGPEANVPDIYVMAGTDTISGGIRCRDLDFSGFSGSLTGAFQSVYGDFVASPTMTTNSGTSPIVFASTSGTTRNITTNGITFNFEVRFDGVGGAWVLQDDLNIASNRVLRTNNGTFNANNKNLIIGGFVAGAGTKTLDMGAGTWTVTGDDATLIKAWRADFAATGLTIIPGTATINMTSANAKTFAGAAKTYGTLNQGGAGAITITGANTFANITNTVQPATITFPASTTTTVGIFKVSGTPAGQITLNSSTAATQATISTLDSRPVTASYVSIQDIAATGKSDWYADAGRGAVDLGNNTGWQFIPLAVRQVICGVMRSIIRPIMYPDLV